MTRRRLLRDGATLSYEAHEGAAATTPFIFQHGMGGEIGQPISYLDGKAPNPTYFLDARGHGESADIDTITNARFDVFADDVIAMADQENLDRFVIGGISLGAATAINLAIRYPHRVVGVVLCRPAWLAEPQAKKNRDVYTNIADLLDTRPVDEALATLLTTDYYRSTVAVSEAAASSLRGQMTRPGAAANSDILRAMPADSPTLSVADWVGVTSPTLVIGHGGDPFHPYNIAEAYAESIPGGRLVTIPSKDEDPAAFASQTRSALISFLTREVPVPR